MSKELLADKRQLMPKKISDYVVAAHRAVDPSARYDTLLKLVEAVAEHLACLLNTEYAVRSTPALAVEKFLRTQRLPLSLGTFVGAIEFLSSNMTEPWALPELAGLRDRVPAECAKGCRALSCAVEARRKFQIPPGRIGAYVEEATKSTQLPGYTLNRSSKTWSNCETTVPTRHCVIGGLTTRRGISSLSLSWSPL